MGFYNIMLEGEQAEAYKKKKAAEAEEKRKEYDDSSRTTAKDTTTFSRNFMNQHNKRGMGNWDQLNYHTPSQDHIDNKLAGSKISSVSDKHKEADKQWDIHHGDKAIKAAEVVGRDQKQRDYENYWGDSRRPEGNIKDTTYAVDAVKKDMRRHPERWKRGKDGQMYREEVGIFESVEFLND